MKSIVERLLMTIGTQDFSTTILHVRPPSPDPTSPGSLWATIKGASTTANRVDASCSEGQYFRNCLVHCSSSSSWRHPAQQTTVTLLPPSKTSRDGISTKSTLRQPPPSLSFPATLAHSPHSAQYLGRKTLPIKRTDAEPLSREDLQYDLLYYIFTDRTKAFIDYLAPDQPVVNFCDLYVNALYNSPKCSKVLKDKMVETPAFAIEFAKIALLTNVGRINTTMACE